MLLYHIFSRSQFANLQNLTKPVKKLILFIIKYDLLCLDFHRTTSFCKVALANGIHHDQTRYGSNSGYRACEEVRTLAVFVYIKV